MVVNLCKDTHFHGHFPMPRRISRGFPGLSHEMDSGNLHPDQLEGRFSTLSVSLFVNTARFTVLCNHGAGHLVPE